MWRLWGGLRGRRGRVRSGSIGASAADQALGNEASGSPTSSALVHREKQTYSDADVAIMPGGPLDLLAEAARLTGWLRLCGCPRSTSSTCGARRCGCADGYRRRAGCGTALTSPAGSPSKSVPGANIDFLPTQRAHRDEILPGWRQRGSTVDLDRIHQRLELLAGDLRELRRLRDLPIANTCAMRCTPVVTLFKSRRRPASIWRITSSPPKVGGPGVTSATASPSSLSTPSSTKRWPGGSVASPDCEIDSCTSTTRSTTVG